MKIKFIIIRIWQTGINEILGNHFYNPASEIIEHKQTLYFAGFILITITHKLKFKKVFKNE